MARPTKTAPPMGVIPGNFGERPDPPGDLNERQAAIWRETVASEPTDFFGTAVTRALLNDYCRHREAAEILSRTLDDFLPEWIKSEDGGKTYAMLLRARQSEARAAMTTATKLRLTNQSRQTPKAAATAARNVAKGSRPWES